MHVSKTELEFENFTVFISSKNSTLTLIHLITDYTKTNDLTEKVTPRHVLHLFLMTILKFCGFRP